MSSQKSLEPPRKMLASYELVNLLGSGGMGSVWLARSRADRSYGTLVALKTMRADQAGDARVRSLFAKEMRLAASIVHENVARVLETGEVDDVPYLAMEWVDGCSVRQLMRAAPDGIPLGIALRITADVCAGLHAAHETLDLVHRDVSPHNVIVARDGTSKLIDFGIAKVQNAVSGDSTSSSGIKGKVRYMAPEQARGQEIDRRADIFALGAMLFELVTGAPPFEGPNDLAILHALLNGEPRPIPDHVPAAVADVLRRSIAKKARDRFATADSMREAVLAALAPSVGKADVARFVALAVPPPESDTETSITEPTHTSVDTMPMRAGTRMRFAAMAFGATLALVGGAFLVGRTERVAAASPPPVAAESPAPPKAIELGQRVPDVAGDAVAHETSETHEKHVAPAAAEKKAPRPAARRAARTAAPDDLATSLRDRR